MIAVARAAAFASKVVILDEPTAALGVRESRRVLDLIRRLRDDGHAVIVISHAMDHVIEVADRAVVMRRGRNVGEDRPGPRQPAAARGTHRRRPTRHSTRQRREEMDTHEHEALGNPADPAGVGDSGRRVRLRRR